MVDTSQWLMGPRTLVFTGNRSLAMWPDCLDVVRGFPSAMLPTQPSCQCVTGSFSFRREAAVFFCQDCGFMVIVRPVLTIVVGVHTDRFGLSVACWKAGVALSKQGLMFANPF